MKKFVYTASRALLLLITLCVSCATQTYYASKEQSSRLEAILLDRGHEFFLMDHYIYVSTNTTKKNICLLTKDFLIIHEKYLALPDDQLFTVLVDAENARIMKDGLQAVATLLIAGGMWWGIWHFCVMPSMRNQRCEVVLLQPAKANSHD